jgi:hypothetical protein
MGREHDSGGAEERGRPRQVRLPGFVSDEPVGLGDVMPCGGCARRAAKLNRLVSFTGRR